MKYRRVTRNPKLDDPQSIGDNGFITELSISRFWGAAPSLIMLPCDPVSIMILITDLDKLSRNFRKGIKSPELMARVVTGRIGGRPFVSGRVSASARW